MAQRLDTNGNVLSSDLYDAYGSRTSTAAQSDSWGFGAQWGHQSDAETGLCLLTNRYYDPAVGRFVTRDPIGYAGGVNLYGYTKNNPSNRTDPGGFEDRSNSPQSGQLINYSSKPIAVIFDKPDENGHRIEWEMVVPPEYETNPVLIDVDAVPGPVGFPWRHIPGNHNGSRTCKAYNLFGLLGGQTVNYGIGLPMRQDKDGFPVDLFYGTKMPILNRTYGNDPKRFMSAQQGIARGYVIQIPK